MKKNIHKISDTDFSNDLLDANTKSLGNEKKKKKPDKLNFIKMENFYISEDTNKGMKEPIE